MRKPRQPGNAAMAGVESSLDGGQREAAPGRDFECHSAGAFAQLIVRDDLVDETHGESLGSSDLGVAVPDILGALFPDQVLQVPGSVAGIEAADHGTDLPEYGTLLGDGEIANHLQYVAAADRKAVDRGDHGFLQAIDAF